ncbi:MAG: DEAD/DEAH box helicase, partial [Natrialbaceae archaeon]
MTAGDAGTGDRGDDGVGSDEAADWEDGGGSDEETDENGVETDEGTTDTSLSIDDFYDAVDAEGRPVLTTRQVARRLDIPYETARKGLDALATAGRLDRQAVERDPVVWYPATLGELADRERIVPFPTRREVVVDRPTQFTRARLAQFAHLVDSTGTDPGTRGYLYRIRREDVWAAPFDDLASLLGAMRSVLPRRSPHLEEWVESQWNRAHQFTLRTHEEDYVVLEAATESLMGNVDRQKLDADQLRAPISDTESWVDRDAVASIKRTLYEAGYPIVDDR